MKKIMILVLSLAVLFGFAACDNSSSTPDNPDQSDVTSAATVVSAMQMVMDDTDGLNGGLVASVKDLLGVAATNVALIEDGEVRTNYTVTISEDDVTSITVHKVVQDAVGTTYPEVNVTVVAKGVDVSADKTHADGTYDIKLDSFTYSFESYMTVGESIVPVTGSVSGWFTGSNTASVTVDATDGVTDYVLDTADTLTFVLPQTAAGITLSIDGESVSDMTTAFDTLSLNYGKSRVPYTFAGFQKEKNDAYETEIKAVVTALTSASSTTKLATAYADLTPAEGTVKPTGTLTGTTATITYVNPTNGTAIQLAADSDDFIYLMPGTTLTLTLEGTAEGTGLKVEKYTLTADKALGVYDAAGAEDANLNDNFGTLTISNLSGKASGTVATNGAGNVTGVATLAFTDMTAGVASATAAVGPALNANGALESALVEVSYAN